MRFALLPKNYRRARGISPEPSLAQRQRFREELPRVKNRARVERLPQLSFFSGIQKDTLGGDRQVTTCFDSAGLQFHSAAPPNRSGFTEPLGSGSRLRRSPLRPAGVFVYREFSITPSPARTCKPAYANSCMKGQAQREQHPSFFHVIPFERPSNLCVMNRNVGPCFVLPVSITTRKAVRRPKGVLSSAAGVEGRRRPSKSNGHLALGVHFTEIMFATHHPYGQHTNASTTPATLSARHGTAEPVLLSRITMVWGWPVPPFSAQGILFAGSERFSYPSLRSGPC